MTALTKKANEDDDIQLIRRYIVIVIVIVIIIYRYMHYANMQFTNDYRVIECASSRNYCVAVFVTLISNIEFTYDFKAIV